MRQHLPLNRSHSLVVPYHNPEKEHDIFIKVDLGKVLQELKKREHLLLNCISEGGKDRVSHKLAEESPALTDD